MQRTSRKRGKEEELSSSSKLTSLPLLVLLFALLLFLVWILNSPGMDSFQPFRAWGGYYREEAIMMLRRFYLSENANGELQSRVSLSLSRTSRISISPRTDPLFFFVRWSVSSQPPQEDHPSPQVRHPSSLFLARPVSSFLRSSSSSTAALNVNIRHRRGRRRQA